MGKWSSSTQVREVDRRKREKGVRRLQVEDVSRLLASARTAGALLLVVPVVVGVALNLFPNYDARAEYFAPSYSHIADAGAAYPVSLALLLAVAVLLILLALALRQAPEAKTSDGMSVVTAGLAASAGGFGIAAALGIPVWLWARQATNGALTMSEAASKSQTLASASQTLILLFGLGGLVVGLTALGVVAYRFGWTPPAVFWTAITFAVVAVVAGLALTLFWFALGIPPVIWTLMIGVSLLTLDSYPTHT